MSDSVKYNALPLPFGRPLSGTNAAALPLPFARLLGQTEEGGSLPDPSDPPAPPPSRRVPVAAAFAFPNAAAAGAVGCLNAFSDGLEVQAAPRFVQSESLPLSACLRSAVVGMQELRRCAAQNTSVSDGLQRRTAIRYGKAEQLRRCTAAHTGRYAKLRRCTEAVLSALSQARACTVQTTTAQQPLARCAALGLLHKQPLCACLRTRHSAALRPPCEWHDIPIPTPPDPETHLCGKRPKSDRLPLPLRRRHIVHHPAAVPLPFACDAQAHTPILKVYMIENKIRATAGGKPLELFSASFTADTSGYCWLGSLTIPPEDFARLDMDGREKGREALIEADINGETFAILAEEYRDNRSFGQKSYTVSGRSRSARLGESYAARRGGLIDNPIYARQIADQALKYSGIRIADWQAADWLIPGGIYSTEGKTPMAVVRELAETAGAFVYSHPARGEISVLPKRKAPAWQQAAPDRVIPASVIVRISGSLSVRPTASGVFVYAEHNQGKAADVYKKGSSREPRAAALIGPLYTDLSVLEAAGVAALNEAGTHKTESVTLPVAEKYAISRAELGEIWEIQEPSGNWQGVVTGLTLSVEIENDAPVVMQTVSIDRYIAD
ncbi:Uncharacterised protein [Kingella potus]|uniref:Uncharacterized protein n=2 Tax=Kingella potus TaxID=265175 RepID=A0A377R262_9NEIS|nr:hypothetical protein [Kingella potus]STQ99858.1 Uncharacterised protein [Kingella potus]STR02403.1 Uncharacterised protein [Kingella potus]